MKTEKTKMMERLLWNATQTPGLFSCFEVTIGFNGRVDYMTYDTRGDVRCYEIKVTKADFHSSCSNTFVGHLNYYVLPKILYESVYEEIPGHIGVYVEENGCFSNIKRAKRCHVENLDVLKDSMIRSLHREVAKKINDENRFNIEHLNQTITRLAQDKDKYSRQYWNLLSEIEDLYGIEWRKGGITYESTD